MLAGTKLGRYKIRSKIGEGGMGEVYLAEDTTLHRRVAIKFLPPGAVADENAKGRLLREAQAAAKLDHPDICAVYEVAEEEGRSFIVMQYVDGETLDIRVKRNQIDFSEALSIAIQVADALGEAHAHGIVHRDIKPSNIIITPRGQPKVMDFGLAKLSEPPAIAGGLKVDAEASTQAFLTTPGAIIGTMPYMSPEQVHGQKLDARTDIFSLGVVLYEMLTRQQPFVAESAAGTISAILTKEPAPLTQYVADSPNELQRIVRKCLEKDRERRYQTMREVAIDLENVRREYESGISVTPATGEYRKDAKTGETNHRASRPAFRFALLLAAIVALAALASVYALFFRHQQGLPAGSVESVNSAAYDTYLRGKLNSSSQNREQNEEAIRILEQVVKTNPGFAPAYAELASAYCIKANLFAPDAEKKKLTDDARVDVEKSLALNPDLAEGHFVRGSLLWMQANHFPHEQAIQSYKRAIALDPNLEEAHHQLGLVYFHIGLFDKAEEEIKKALKINPSDTLARFRLGSIDVSRAKYEEALAILKTVPSEANPAIVDRAMATALLQLGRTQEASEVVEHYLKTYPTDEGGNVTSVKAMLLAKAGKEQEAEETIRRAIEIGKSFQHFHHTTYNLACAYALLNKPDEALKWLQFTADDGFPCYPLFANDANLNSLRKDERFIAFMAKLKQQWERWQSTL